MISRMLSLLLWGTTTVFILRAFIAPIMDPAGCRMTFMWPGYVDIPVDSRLSKKYSLVLFKERGFDSSDEPMGIPVLFIPGHAGSSRQVRSLGSVAAHVFEALKSSNKSMEPFDFYAGFGYCKTLYDILIMEQAEFTNSAISVILSLYEKGRFGVKPKSVILIGHSMGGIVARTLFTLPNFVEQSINTIVTLATPHAKPPIQFDYSLVNHYNRLRDFWSTGLEFGSLRNISVVSIAGGNQDTLVLSETTEVNGFVPSRNGFAVFSTGIPLVWSPADHRCILWCNQLLQSIIYSLYDIIDVRSSFKTIDLERRTKAFGDRLKHRFIEMQKPIGEGFQTLSTLSHMPKSNLIDVGHIMHKASSNKAQGIGVSLNESITTIRLLWDLRDEKEFSETKLLHVCGNTGEKDNQCRPQNITFDRIPKFFPAFKRMRYWHMLNSNFKLGSFRRDLRPLSYLKKRENRYIFIAPLFEENYPLKENFGVEIDASCIRTSLFRFTFLLVQDCPEGEEEFFTLNQKSISEEKFYAYANVSEIILDTHENAMNTKLKLWNNPKCSLKSFSSRLHIIASFQSIIRRLYPMWTGLVPCLSVMSLYVKATFGSRDSSLNSIRRYIISFILLYIGISFSGMTSLTLTLRDIIVFTPMLTFGVMLAAVSIHHFVSLISYALLTSGRVLRLNMISRVFHSFIPLVIICVISTKLLPVYAFLSVFVRLLDNRRVSNGLASSYLLSTSLVHMLLGIPKTIAFFHDLQKGWYRFGDISLSDTIAYLPPAVYGILGSSSLDKLQRSSTLLICAATMAATSILAVHWNRISFSLLFVYLLLRTRTKSKD
ncbi:PGAP1-like protein-domain-containing protein [Chytridium lagenaria]|nr:PGAP1-like protein-domain-containing protein [Chytridium lagenaria]